MALNLVFIYAFALSILYTTVRHKSIGAGRDILAGLGLGVLNFANIALYDGNSWYTPAHPLLRGTKRAELLDNQLIVEKDISWLQLDDYTHIMLFNAMIDWKHIILPINEKHLIL